MRYFFLIPIIAYGVFVAWHTLLPVPTPKLSSHASASLNTLAFYLACVIVYLAVNKGKELGILLIYSIFVIGFVARLMFTLHQ